MTSDRTVVADGADPQEAASSRELTGTRASDLRHTRRWVAKELDNLGAAHRDDVVLVADELLSNAYEHGDGPHLIRVAWRRSPCLVTIEVEDDNHGALTVGQSRLPGNRGRGLVIIERLADNWGVHNSPTAEPRKTVWAEIPCGEAPCAPEDQHR